MLQAIQMQIAGRNWIEIAETVLNANGERQWGSGQAAWMAVNRLRKRRLKEIDEDLSVLQARADERLDFLRRQTVAVMLRPHYLYQGGKAVLDQDGEQVLDDAPKLAAVGKYLSIEERWAKLHGVDSQEKLTVALERRAEVESVIATEAILAAFDTLNLDAGLRQRALEAAQERISTLGDEPTEGESS